MSFDKNSATNRAKKDLAVRLDKSKSDIDTISVTDVDFPDMSLGAQVDGEMSGQMISSGWKIVLGAKEKKFEYRADKYQIRLVGFKGTNHIVES